MKQAIPDKIKIGGIQYSIVIGAPQHIGDGDILCGEVTYHDATIYLNRDLNEQVMRQTLLHEIVHVFMRQMGRKDLNEDEYFVDALSLNLYQLLNDNGWPFGFESDQPCEEEQPCT